MEGYAFSALSPGFTVVGDTF